MCKFPARLPGAGDAGMAAIKILNLATAFANRKQPNSTWNASAPNEAGEVWPHFQPSFSFSSSATIFTIGSCFARNIEKALIQLGCVVPMLDFKTRPEEWEGGPGDMLNKFTPPNFRSSIQWAADIFDRDGQVRESDCLDFALDLGA